MQSSIHHAFAVVLLWVASASGQTSFAVPSPGFATIQSAIDASSTGDVILVAPGTYYETIDFSGKPISVRATSGPTVTVIDAQQMGTVVRFVSGEGPGSLLEGFTLINGLGVSGLRQPGGVHCDYASPVIRNCEIRSCETAAGALATAGAALCDNNSDALFESCVFFQNDGVASGLSIGPGAIECLAGSDVRLLSCRILENTGFAAVRAVDSDIIIRDCVIEGNSGRGIHTLRSGPVIESSSVSSNGNTGIFCERDSSSFPPGPIARILQCVVSENVGNVESGARIGHAGGIRLRGQRTQIENCLIHSNEGGTGTTLTGPLAPFGGGAFYGASGTGGISVEVFSGSLTSQPYSVEITGTTVVDNLGGTNSLSGPTALASGGGLHNLSQATVEVRNSILWGNRNGSGQLQQVNGGASVAVSGSNVPGYSGQGNIASDPLFVDSMSKDYRLRPTSPCVDAGLLLAGLSPTDRIGNPRAFPILPDMGSEEWLPDCQPGNVGDPNGGAAIPVLSVGLSGDTVVSRVQATQGILIDVAQPPSNPNPADFILAMTIGAPNAQTSLPTPFGEFCFTPSFVFASSLASPIGLLAATAAPTRLFVPPLPFVGIINLQGVIVANNSVSNSLALTNSVVIVVE